MSLASRLSHTIISALFFQLLMFNCTAAKSAHDEMRTFWAYPKDLANYFPTQHRHKTPIARHYLPLRLTDRWLIVAIKKLSELGEIFCKFQVLLASISWPDNPPHTLCHRPPKSNCLYRSDKIQKLQVLMDPLSTPGNSLFPFKATIKRCLPFCKTMRTNFIISPSQLPRSQRQKKSRDNIRGPSSLAKDVSLIVSGFPCELGINAW